MDLYTVQKDGVARSIDLDAMERMAELGEAVLGLQKAVRELAAGSSSGGATALAYGADTQGEASCLSAERLSEMEAQGAAIEAALAVLSPALAEIRASIEEQRAALAAQEAGELPPEPEDAEPADS